MILRAVGQRLAEARAVSSWGPTNAGDIPPPWAADGVPNLNALPVGEARALRASAVYACHQVIVDDVSTLPVKRFRRDGERRERLDLPALFDAPVRGEIVDTPEWLARLLSSLVLRGNAYGRVLEIDDHGATQVDPLHPDNCTPVRDDRGRLGYKVRTGRRTEVLTPWGPTGGDIWHTRGLTQPGHDAGLSVVGHAQAAITLALAAETFGADFFLDGAMPSSVLSTPEKFPDNSTGRSRARQVVRDFERVHRGRRRTALLSGGAEWKAITLTPNESQFIETRKFQLEDIARLFRVKPHKIGILDRATFSNIEQQALEHVIETLRTWIVRLETSIARLFPGAGPGEYFRLDPAALLRGDLKTRYEAYALGRQWGFRSPNQILALEDEDPIGPEGDVFLSPLNMRDASGPSFAERMNAAGILVRAGYDPDDVATAFGFADIAHTGAIPVTVQTTDDVMPPAPAPDPAPQPAPGDQP